MPGKAAHQRQATDGHFEQPYDTALAKPFAHQQSTTGQRRGAFNAMDVLFLQRCISVIIKHW